jgi:circadian clock protein KaiB
VKTIKTRRPPREISSPDGLLASARRISRGKTPALEKSLAARPTGQYFFRLFVAGATARSRQAVLRVRELCELKLNGRGRLEVIDIYQQPGLAREHQIVATPTLIIVSPPPARRFIGSLTNLTELFPDLNLAEKG